MNTQDSKYPQISKLIASPHQNYFVPFAMRYPVVHTNECRLPHPPRLFLIFMHTYVQTTQKAVETYYLHYAEMCVPREHPHMTSNNRVGGEGSEKP